MIFALSTVTAVSHQLEFPYRNFEKFYGRAHFWMMMGLPILGISFYLTLAPSVSAAFNDAPTITSNGGGAAAAIVVPKFGAAQDR